ncbi:K+-transporting ATPase ATPase C chain [Parafrankia irregularis]|uniref:Potassium-transporting ATPase KdpC subunit n=1 Tax=Parafrankia irregularis TaxID=795642 RepID=A0A0S4QUW9_9ACTN|nr:MULTISPECIES: potassium-transporting ATPase subunit C [Parafrankia]MBE3201552.1 potassium-transporting ATPase subunit C [Parafrankia sp. CH37]CUU59377.1 K+-transporting ATPase ATPase C chain [Parafrankia irregularis]
MSTLPSWIRQHLAALRALLVLTVLVGLAYPLAILAIAQIPGLKGKADGSFVTNAEGQRVGSSLIGQSFTDADGNALPAYFQSRPSAAGDGYDPTSTSASNLGPEDVVDSIDDPATPDEDESGQSLLTQVCERSLAVGEREGVDGSRRYCTASGVGAVLAVYHAGPGFEGAITRVVSVNEACPATPFLASYQGVAVECRTPGDDIAAGERVLVRGDAPEKPVVPADAVTASASGLDPGISPAYAELQIPRIARERALPVDEVRDLVDENTTGRALGFIGAPNVNVLELNLDLDRVKAAP